MDIRKKLIISLCRYVSVMQAKNKCEHPST